MIGTGTGTDDGPGASSRQGIQSVELAMSVLESVEAGRGPMTLTQIAASSGMSASKVHRYLVSLTRVGAISQSRRSGLYDLGPALRRIGTEALRRMDEVGTTTEFLPGLRDLTSHSVNAAVWGDHGPVIVHWDYGSHPLPINVRVGATLPLLDSSIGRVFLAHLPEAMTRPVLVEQLGTRAVDASLQQIVDLGREVRAQGFAVTSGGVIPGLVSLAAPVFPASEIPLAISVAIPARVADVATRRSVERALLSTTAAITQALGGQPRQA